MAKKEQEKEITGDQALEGKTNLVKVFQGMKDKISEISTAFWLGGWLFTIGFVGLKGWSLIWSLVLWPYYLGSKLNGLLFK